MPDASKDPRKGIPVLVALEDGLSFVAPEGDVVEAPYGYLHGAAILRDIHHSIRSLTLKYTAGNELAPGSTPLEIGLEVPA